MGGAVVGGEKGGERRFLLVLFVADLHSGLLCCIFAVARGSARALPFFRFPSP